MATGELRERVRERLVSAEEGLARALAGAPPERPRRARRAARRRPARRGARCAASASPRALAGFDAATIATTHGFCQEVLGGLGIDGDVEPDAVFVEDVSDLLSDVVDDLYVRRFHGRDTPDFDRAEAMRIARGRRRQPGGADRAAGRAGGHGRGDARAPRAGRARGARAPQARAWAVMTYDDLLTRLRRGARGRRRRGRGRAAARALPRRARRRVPGHRPGAVGHHAPRVRRRRT